MDEHPGLHPSRVGHQAQCPLQLDLVETGQFVQGASQRLEMAAKPRRRQVLGRALRVVGGRGAQEGLCRLDELTGGGTTTPPASDNKPQS